MDNKLFIINLKPIKYKMNKSDLITKKLQELVELAKIEQEPSVQIVLLTLLGARCGNLDGMLANKVQEYTKDVLIPKTMGDMNNQIASNN